MSKRYTLMEKEGVQEPPRIADPASFWTQTDALLRKNLTFQMRNKKENIRLVLFPVALLLLMRGIQRLAEKEFFNDPDRKCGCVCANDRRLDAVCSDSEKTICGPEYSHSEQFPFCAFPSPFEWPPMLQLPDIASRAVRTSFAPFTDLPDESCRANLSCPFTFLVTGSNQSFGQNVIANMFPRSLSMNENDNMTSLSTIVLGSETPLDSDIIYDPGLMDGRIYYLQQDPCPPDSGFSFGIKDAGIGNLTQERGVLCAQAKPLWRNSSSEINDELYKGYVKGNNEGKANEIVTAFDLLNSNQGIFNVSIWYNSTYKGEEGLNMARIPKSINLISNAYLQSLLGPDTKILFEFVKEMPKSSTQDSMDVATLLGFMFYAFVVLNLFPIILTALVYDKEQKLRIMMKMHGLGDGPYWVITYAYFLAISMIYVLCFVTFGSVLGLQFFTENAYSVQFVFFFVYLNLQITMAFLMANMLSNVKTARVFSFILLFASVLLCQFLFKNFVESPSFPRSMLIVMELFPVFALYRGVMDLSYATIYGDGMRFGDLINSDSGTKEVLIIMFFEWIVVLLFAYYLDQVFGSRKPPLFFLKGSQRKPLPAIQRQRSQVSAAQMEKRDVIQEREKVGQLLSEPTHSHAIVCDNLKKVYPARDGNSEKFAVKGMYLAVPYGECLGMLGPNGAGKTSFISMMIGLTKPSSGGAYVQGLDINTQMNGIYANMGVCPQYDLLWETLTGREHLLFYGRLKNLKGTELTQAVEDSLKKLNLFNGGVADKQAGKYSGGMKRRLSVAISLMGNPGVVYLDEPSTGLDPASRTLLWNVIKSARKGRAIILTTHSMEEAEALCDRLGIFVNGSLQCIGNAKELKGRYGGTYVLTMTTSPEHENNVEDMVQRLSPNANKIYHLSGTQKFELPKAEVRIADVFQAVEFAKTNFQVSAWGVADTTLEDVFIKVARGAQASESLS